MIVVLVVLALAVIAEPIIFFRYLDHRDKREWDERSELLSRIQAPQVMNPRALAQEPVSAPEPPEQDLRELAGSVSGIELPLNSDG